MKSQIILILLLLASVVTATTRPVPILIVNDQTNECALLDRPDLYDIPEGYRTFSPEPFLPIEEFLEAQEEFFRNAILDTQGTCESLGYVYTQVEFSQKISVTYQQFLIFALPVVLLILPLILYWKTSRKAGRIIFTLNAISAALVLLSFVLPRFELILAVFVIPVFAAIGLGLTDRTDKRILLLAMANFLLALYAFFFTLGTLFVVGV